MFQFWNTLKQEKLIHKIRNTLDSTLFIRHFHDIKGIHINQLIDNNYK